MCPLPVPRLIAVGFVLVGGPGGGGSRGGYQGGGGNDSEVIVQQDTIFVAGMDPSVTMDEIAEFFGVLGIIKVSLVNDLLILFPFSHSLNRSSLLRPAEGPSHEHAQDLGVQGQEHGRGQGGGDSDVR